MKRGLLHSPRSAGCHLSGLSTDELKRRAKISRTADDFYGPIDAWLESIGLAW